MSALGISRFGELPRRPSCPRHRLAEDARGARSRSGDPAAEARGRLLALPLPLQRERRRSRTPSRASNGPGSRTRSEGRTPALSDAQARRLLRAPEGKSLLARRDRALLAVLLYHGLRRDEIVHLTVGSLHEHRGVPHFRVRGKGSKTRPVPRPPGRALGPRTSTSSSLRHQPRPAGTAVPADPGPLGRPADLGRRHLQARAQVRLGRRHPHGAHRPRAPGHGRHQCPRARGRHRPRPGTGSATPTSAPPGSTTEGTARPEDSPTFRVSY